MAGVAAIAAQGELSRLAALAFNGGDVMMFIAAVLYAGYTIGLRQRPRVSGVSLLAGMALAAFVTSVPLMIWEIAAGGFVWPTAAGYATLVYVALGPAFISQIFFMRGVELIGPGRAGRVRQSGAGVRRHHGGSHSGRAVRGLSRRRAAAGHRRHRHRAAWLGKSRILRFY